MKRSTLFILTVAAASFAVFCGIAVNTEANDAFAVTDAVADPARTPVDQAYAGQLLSLHNELRQKYNVPPLVWDSALANTAQTWAEKIALSGITPPEHRQNESIGENIVWGMSGAFTPQFLVDRWSREAGNYDLATNTCAAGKYCVHFTQMVWSTTTKLGCGKATTADGKTDFVVCDYNPRGNMAGQTPYKPLPLTTAQVKPPTPAPAPTPTPATADCEACSKKVQDLTAQVEKLKQEIAAAFDQKIKDDVKIGLDLLERIQNEREKCDTRMAESLEERRQRMNQYLREEAERDDKYLKRIKKCVLSIKGVPHPDSVEWCFNVRDY